MQTVCLSGRLPGRTLRANRREIPVKAFGKWRRPPVGVVVALILLSGCSAASVPSGHESPGEPSTPRTATGTVRTKAAMPAAWRRLAARSLRIPRLAPRAPCPVTRHWTPPSKSNLPAIFTPHRRLGTGPAFPGAYTAPGPWLRRTTMELPRVQHPDVALPAGWLMAKVLWMVNRDYKTPLLVRGRQVDGPHRMLLSTDTASTPRPSTADPKPTRTLKLCRPRPGLLRLADRREARPPAADLPHRSGQAMTHELHVRNQA